MARDSIGIASKSEVWKECFALFQEQRENGELCDVTLIMEGGNLNAHKLVLSSRSPFFRSMFTTPMKEANMNEIMIPDIHYQTMEQIIQFIYTSQLLICTETAQDLLIAANYLRMTSLVNLCGNYVIKHIDEANCFSIRGLLISTNCDKDIIERANYYINSNFLKIVQNESFIQLGVDDAVELLSRSELCYIRKNNVFDAATTWLAKAKDSKKHAERILQCIRVSLLSDNYNKDNCNVVLNSQIKVTRTLKTVLLGLYNEDDKSSFHMYDSSTKTWTKFMEMRRKNYHNVAVSKDYIFVTGLDEETHENFFEVYNRKTTEFTTIPSLANDIRFVRMVTVGNSLYVFKQSNRLFSTLHIYSMDIGIWFIGPELVCNFFYSEVVVIDKCIYVFGCLVEKSIKKLDTETNLWSDVPSMKNYCESLVATAYKERIYVIGGSCELGPTIFEVYDPLKNEWRELENLPETQPGVLIGVSDGIYAIRKEYAEDNITFTCCLQFYDVVRDEWTVEERLPVEFPGCPLAAIPELYLNG